MDVKQTVDNVSGIGVVNDIDQLSSIWDGTTVISDAAQLVDGLAKSDANRNQQISQAEAQIAAEQKQVQANEQAIEAGTAKLAAPDLDVARLEGRQQQLEVEAAELRK